MIKIEHYTFQGMGNLVDADHLSSITSVSVQRINELVELLLIPHLRIDGGQPLFKKSEAVKWVKDNLLTRVEGSPIPIRFVVNCLASPSRQLPLQLQEMDGRVFQGISASGINPPCVYFLVSDGCITYIGQSVTLGSRLIEHRASGKIWDTVFWIPTPIQHLRDVEQWWIRHVKPPLNSEHEIKGHDIEPPAHCIKN